MENEIVIKPSYVFWDYFKINLYILINKFEYYIFLPICFSLLFFDVYNVFTGEKDIIELVKFPTIIFLMLPFLIFITIYKITKRSLSNKKLKEDIKIIITKNNIDYKGESFNIKYEWDDFIKIKETKNWFLFFINKKQAQVIRKKDLNDNELKDLKELFNSLKIKKSLK